MKRYNHIIILLLAILLCGCKIKEDREDCDNAYVFFSYYGDGTRQIFSEKIGKVNMFVYDRDGRLADNVTLDSDVLDNHTKVMLSLPSGHYDIVCWGNARSATDLQNTDNKGSAKTSVKPTAGGGHYNGADSLYIGRQTIRVIQDKLTRDTVHFAGAHVKMIVKMSGFSDGQTLSDAPVVGVRAHKTFASVDFDHNQTGEQAVCSPDCSAQQGDDIFYMSKFNLLRFEDDNDIELELYETASGHTIRSVSLGEFMEDNGISIYGRHEVTVGVHFVKTNTAINIKPWESSEIIPEW